MFSTIVTSQTDGKGTESTIVVSRTAGEGTESAIAEWGIGGPRTPWPSPPMTCPKAGSPRI